MGPTFLLVINLYSEDNRFDETFLANYAIINMQYLLARLPGVGQVSVRGAGKYSMRVWLYPNKLQYYGLTTLDVQRAIQSQNVEVVADSWAARRFHPTKPSSSPPRASVGFPT